MKQIKGFQPKHGYVRTGYNPKSALNLDPKAGHGKYKTEPGTSGFKQVIRQYKIGAAQRGIDFMLSDSDVKRLTKSNCFYCNAIPAKKAYCTKQRTISAKIRGEYVYNGIDRADNTKPYILENCVPCCRTCNLAKNNMPFDDFIEWISNLVRNYGGDLSQT